MNQQRRPTKHVEAYLTELKDAGSIPATSTIFFPIKKDVLPVREDVFFVLLGKENGVHVMLRITWTASTPHHFIGNKFPLKWFVVSASVAGNPDRSNKDIKEIWITRHFSKGLLRNPATAKTSYPYGRTSFLFY